MLPGHIPLILGALNREVVDSLRLAAAIAHGPESGRAREGILRAFLTHLLPSAYEASTGFVIDATGVVSRQIDIVVYRTDYAPVFDIGGIKHFIVESVAAVFEVKAAIDSTTDLDEALENIASVKRLDRTNGGRNYVVNGRVRGVMVDPDRYEHQVFGGIVTQDSLARDTFSDRLMAYLRAHPRREWPNTYVDVDDWATSYQASDGTVSPDSSGATVLFISDGSVRRSWSLPPVLSISFA